MSMWQLALYARDGQRFDTYYFDEKPDRERGGSGIAVYRGKGGGRDQEVWVVSQNVAAWAIIEPEQQQQ